MGSLTGFLGAMIPLLGSAVAGDGLFDLLLGSLGNVVH